MTTPVGFSINDLTGYSYLVMAAFFVIAGSGSVVAFSHYFAKFILIKLINKVFDKKRAGLGQLLYNNHFFHRIAYLTPAILLYHFSYLFNIRYPHFTLLMSDLVILITNVYITIGIAFVVSALLNTVNARYNQLPIAKLKPIKSYIQVAKIILFGITGIFIASTISDKSPAYFFTGAGAAAAFLALIFKDSMMGFVASIQLAAYDMLRIGDWIEMPNYGADGEVIDISLNTVKVQNFDKTIVTIPSYALLTSGLKNWRGMQESGGRRVKRGITIDINSIKICEEKSFDLTTNIGLFRSYLEKYLRQHPGVHKHMKILVRQLQGTPTGLPLELYFFANEIDSEKYEAIQADIIEHAYAIMSRFNLRAFQYASDADNS